MCFLGERWAFAYAGCLATRVQLGRVLTSGSNGSTHAGK